MNTINPENLPQIVWQNHKVITTNLLAQCYEAQEKQIRQNYINNKDRFVEGKHFFKVEGEDLRSLLVDNIDSQNADDDLQISSKTRTLMLWTEKGAVRHAKILDTDKAWEVQERLEEAYFHPERKTGSYIAELAPAQELLDTQRRLIASQQDQIAYIRQVCDEKVTQLTADHKKALHAAEQNYWREHHAVQQLQGKEAYWEQEFNKVLRSKRSVGHFEAVEILSALFVHNRRTDAVAEAHYRSVEAIRKVRRNWRIYQLPAVVSAAIYAAMSGE